MKISEGPWNKVTQSEGQLPAVGNSGEQWNTVTGELSYKFPPWWYLDYQLSTAYNMPSIFTHCHSVPPLTFAPGANSLAYFHYIIILIRHLKYPINFHTWNKRQPCHIFHDMCHDKWNETNSKAYLVSSLFLWKPPPRTFGGSLREASLLFP